MTIDPVETCGLAYGCFRLYTLKTAADKKVSLRRRYDIEDIEYILVELYTLFMCGMTKVSLPCSSYWLLFIKSRHNLLLQTSLKVCNHYGSLV